MAKNNYYAVIKGRKTGIFPSWAETKELVDGYPSATYMGFPNYDGAKDWLDKQMRLESAKNQNQIDGDITCPHCGAVISGAMGGSEKKAKV